MKNSFIYPSKGITSIHFDEQGNLVKSGIFKYIMLATLEGDLQMLLMTQGSPFDYHAEALLDYMEHESISEIKTNGGGKIRFNLEEQSISVEGRSYAFGRAYPPEVTAFLKGIFPSFEIYTSGMDVNPDQKEMAISGRVRSLKDVQYEADNP